MAIETLFLDGFDSYSSFTTYYYPLGPWAYTSASTIGYSTSSGRGGGGCFDDGALTSPSFNYVTLGKSARTVVVGFAYYLDAIPNVAYTHPLRLFAGADGFYTPTQVSLVLGTDGIFRFYRGDSTTLLASGTTVLQAASWYYVEARVYIDNTNGEVELKLDGNTEIALTTGLDTQTDASVNSVRSVGLFQGDYSYNDNAVKTKFDDFYVRGDVSANTAGGFLGDVRIVSLFPDANGTHRDFTPSTGSDDFAVIDEVPVSTADYLSSGTAADRVTCGFESVPAGAAIKSATLMTHTAISEDGTREISPVCKSGATTLVGASKRTLQDRYVPAEAYDVDPNTASAWTEAGLNAAEFGIEID